MQHRRCGADCVALGKLSKATGWVWSSETFTQVSTRACGPVRHGGRRRGESGASGRSGKSAPGLQCRGAARRTPDRCPGVHHRITSRDGSERICRAGAPRPAAPGARAQGPRQQDQASAQPPGRSPGASWRRRSDASRAAWARPTPQRNQPKAQPAPAGIAAGRSAVCCPVQLRPVPGSPTEVGRATPMVPRADETSSASADGD
jgi:hypothetical protein